MTLQLSQRSTTHVLFNQFSKSSCAKYLLNEDSLCSVMSVKVQIAVTMGDSKNCVFNLIVETNKKRMQLFLISVSHKIQTLDEKVGFVFS